MQYSLQNMSFSYTVPREEESGVNEAITGGCNCGAIRYELHRAPIVVAACHCVNCRRQSGAAYSINLVVPAPGVELTGEPARYLDRGDESGQPVIREFCGTCGSPIRSLPAATPQIVAVKAGTLDDPDRFAPTVHIWTRSAVSWAAISDDAMRFDKGPPAR